MRRFSPNSCPGLALSCRSCIARPELLASQDIRASPGVRSMEWARSATDRVLQKGCKSGQLASGGAQLRWSCTGCRPRGTFVAGPDFDQLDVPPECVRSRLGFRRSFFFDVGRAADVGGPDMVCWMAPGPRISSPWPALAPARRYAIQIRASGSRFWAEVRLITLRAGQMTPDPRNPPLVGVPTPRLFAGALPRGPLGLHPCGPRAVRRRVRFPRAYTPA